MTGNYLATIPILEIALVDEIQHYLNSLSLQQDTTLLGFPE